MDWELYDMTASGLVVSRAGPELTGVEDVHKRPQSQHTSLNE